jgi:hypothetical protein
VEERKRGSVRQYDLWTMSAHRSGALGDIRDVTAAEGVADVL